MVRPSIEAGTLVLRARRIAPTDSNRKQSVEEVQAAKRFRAPWRKGGRTSTAMDGHEEIGQNVRVEIVAREVKLE